VDFNQFELLKTPNAQAKQILEQSGNAELIYGDSSIWLSIISGRAYPGFFLDVEWIDICTKFGVEIGHSSAFTRFAWIWDILLLYETRSTQRRLRSKIGAKFRTFYPCKIRKGMREMCECYF